MSLTELRRTYMLPRPCEAWRTCPNVVGQINALENFRGMAIATNGIMVALMTSAGNIMFGHLDWFVPDEKEDMAKIVSPAKSTRTSKRLSPLDEFCEAV